jgi:hypothetical protein
MRWGESLDMTWQQEQGRRRGRVCGWIGLRAVVGHLLVQADGMKRRGCPPLSPHRQVILLLGFHTSAIYSLSFLASTLLQARPFHPHRR